MAAIKSANTKPELIVRKIAWKLGHRYRLQPKLKIGRPDLAFKVFIANSFTYFCMDTRSIRRTTEFGMQNAVNCFIPKFAIVLLKLIATDLAS